MSIFVSILLSTKGPSGEASTTAELTRRPRIVGLVPRPKLANVQFRLTAAGFEFWVDVRLRSWGDRWLAVADISGEPEIGLGQTARRALEGALESLGRRAARAFLADAALSAVTAEISRQEPPTEPRP